MNGGSPTHKGSVMRWAFSSFCLHLAGDCFTKMANTQAHVADQFAGIDVLDDCLKKCIGIGCKSLDWEWVWYFDHDDVIEWKLFPRYCSLWGESTGHRWVPLTKASNGESVSLWWHHYGIALVKLHNDGNELMNTSKIEYNFRATIFKP